MLEEEEGVVAGGFELDGVLAGGYWVDFVVAGFVGGDGFAAYDGDDGVGDGVAGDSVGDLAAEAGGACAADEVLGVSEGEPTGIVGIVGEDDLGVFEHFHEHEVDGFVGFCLGFGLGFGDVFAGEELRLAGLEVNQGAVEGGLEGGGHDVVGREFGEVRVDELVAGSHEGNDVLPTVLASLFIIRDPCVFAHHLLVFHRERCQDVAVECPPKQETILRRFLEEFSVLLMGGFAFGCIRQSFGSVYLGQHGGDISWVVLCHEKGKQRDEINTAIPTITANAVELRLGATENTTNHNLKFKRLNKKIQNNCVAVLFDSISFK